MGNDDSAPLVGLVGPAGAGKDTIAGLLVEHGFYRVAFADRLARFVERIDPVFAALVAAHGGYEPAKRAHPYIRNRMIEVGDGAREIIHPNTWLDAVEDEIFGLDDPGIPVVISDVRFLAEATWIEENGGVIVSVQRPGFSLTSPETRAISSTAELFIENDGDIHQLRERVDMIAEDFLL